MNTNIKKYIKILSFLFLLFTPFLGKSLNVEHNNVYKQELGCKHSIHYPEHDLLEDIQNNVPYQKAKIEVDMQRNRMRILYDSQGNDAQHQWMRNVNMTTGEPGNEFFFQENLINYMNIEPQHYALRSVELMNCLCPYQVYAAPDSFGINYRCQELHEERNHGIYLYTLTYFD